MLIKFVFKISDLAETSNFIRKTFKGKGLHRVFKYLTEPDVRKTKL